ncbi:MAG: hypothetical protein KDB94_11460, partial [Acidobacteria bacterium]|nr:hypothetical protein [Acidobacteriota bacterium]
STSGSSGTEPDASVWPVWDSSAFADIVDAAEVLLELDDAARAEIWVSAVFGLWRDPGASAEEDPSRVDIAFVEYLTSHPGPVPAAVLAASAALGDAELVALVTSAAAAMPASSAGATPAVRRTSATSERRIVDERASARLATARSSPPRATAALATGETPSSARTGPVAGELDMGGVYGVIEPDRP